MYVHKTHQSVFKCTKDPQKQQIALELPDCTANVCRELQGLYREIRVQGFQIYGDCMYTCNPCNFQISTVCNICREFDLQGFYRDSPHQMQGNHVIISIFGDIHAKFAGIPCNFSVQVSMQILLWKNMYTLHVISIKFTGNPC